MNIGGKQEHWQRWGWVLWDTFLNALDDNNRRTEIEITDQMCWSACIIYNDWLTSKYLIARPQSCQKCDTIGRLNKATKTNFVYCPRSGQCGSQPLLLCLIRVIPQQHFQVATRQYSRDSWHKGEWWPVEVSVNFCDCFHKLQRRYLLVPPHCWKHLQALAF